MNEHLSTNSIVDPEDEPALGACLHHWTPRPHPLSDPRFHTLQGRYCRLELLNCKTDDMTIEQLYEVFKPTENLHFIYLSYGPFQTIDHFRQFLHLKEQPNSNTVLYSIKVNEILVGFIGLLRIDQEHGVIEIGHVNYSSQLARTRQATEVTFLLLQFSFDRLGYRRVEWKADILHQKSQRAAVRLGFQYDGTWLKAQVSKGRSRSLACYSILDDEWISVKEELQRWLHLDNFDRNGHQLTKLNAAQVNPRRVRKTNEIS